MVPQCLLEEPEVPNIITEIIQIVAYRAVVHRRQKEGNRRQPFVLRRRLAHTKRNTIDNNSVGFSAKVFKENSCRLVRCRAE